MDTKEQEITPYMMNPELDAILEIADEQEFEDALEAYLEASDNMDLKDYVRATRKRMVDTNAAYEQVEKANGSLHTNAD